MPSFRWFRKRSAAAVAANPCQGNLETISPTLLTGWVFHPQSPHCEVRLVSGSRLIAAARADVDRPDVVAHIGSRGRFGFTLAIPDSHPEPSAAEPLQLFALTEDGQVRFPLLQSGSDAALTEQRLRTALSSKLRGMVGHFDGLSADGRRLEGWCYSRQGGGATVWLHCQGLAPRPLACREVRPGMRVQGHAEESGFSLLLQDWPELAGRSVWASFDEAGVLPLPPVTPVPMPDSLPPSLALPAQGELSPSLASAQPLPMENAEMSDEFQAHWRAIEEFRQLIDRMEREVQQAETQSYREALSSSRLPAFSRKRSALFRLWR
jgi:hypothetical protein